eukprot:13888138-Alexandrium_andersonii.AAC.1
MAESPPPMAESSPPMAEVSPRAPALPPRAEALAGVRSPMARLGGKRRESGAPDARLLALRS